MINLKAYVRKATNAAVSVFPTPLVRFVLKSFFYEQSLQNRVQYHIQPYRYDTPIPDVSEIDLARLAGKRALAGIIPELATFDALIDQLKPFAAEVSSFPTSPDGNPAFWFHNGGYEDFDAVTLYALLRHLKPPRMIEVGCGFSSRMTTMAAVKNTAEGFKMECLFVEPFPPSYLLNYQLSGPLLVEKIQQVPVERFAALKSGDVLFIDTSHVLKTQNDLCYILHDIMPALAKGVYLHFHDIFTPFEYPADWLLKNGFHFNEQYALEAILCNSPDFEIILPVHGLWRERRQKLFELLPHAEKTPAAFWLRKKL